jgi:hypothetical protein
MQKRILILLIQALVVGLIESPAFARPLNPSPDANPSETTIDRYFRVAFTAATGGDFDTAIINYHRAMVGANNECDRKHAEAGVDAAKQAKTVQQRFGARAKPTQGFWALLQKLTSSDRCVYIK